MKIEVTPVLRGWSMRFRSFSRVDLGSAEPQVQGRTAHRFAHKA